MDSSRRTDENEGGARSAPIQTVASNIESAARNWRRESFRIPRQESRQAYQQQHNALRSLPTWLQRQDDRSRLPCSGKPLLNETGFRVDVIERQLAHCERNEVRGAYNRAEYLPERKKMMQNWADYLDALASGAKVTLFKAA